MFDESDAARDITGLWLFLELFNLMIEATTDERIYFSPVKQHKARCSNVALGC